MGYSDAFSAFPVLPEFSDAEKNSFSRVTRQDDVLGWIPFLLRSIAAISVPIRSDGYIFPDPLDRKVERGYNTHCTLDFCGSVRDFVC